MAAACTCAPFTLGGCCELFELGFGLAHLRADRVLV